MKKSISVLLLIMGCCLSETFVAAQTGQITFSGRNTQYRTTVTLDSIYILNKTMNKDTMLIGSSLYNYSISTGSDDFRIPDESGFSISTSYPNPFGLETSFSLTVTSKQIIEISVFNVFGQRVASLSDIYDPGVHLFQLHCHQLSSGLYIISAGSEFTNQSIKVFKSGEQGGNDVHILHQGLQLSENPLLKGQLKSGPDDLFQFIGYARSYCPDTINDQILVNGNNYRFGFSAGCGPESFWYDGFVYPMALLEIWGMGYLENGYIHQDRSYNWYIDQANTGQSSGNNCGPSSVTMAAKWSDSTFSLTAEDARNTYPMDGGWWYTNNIIDYLNLYNIPNALSLFADSLQLEEILDDGAIMIVCLSTEFLRRNTKPNERTDRFYGYASGHFFVIKGLRKVDNQYFFEVYDPNNWNMEYLDDSEKGKNRHYRASDLKTAISNWWPFLIIVYPTGDQPLKRTFYPGSIDPTQIVHMWGN